MAKEAINPKDAIGRTKWRHYASVPVTVLWELGIAMYEGARKYRRYNYRVARVFASVYLDAAKGHMDQWWEGEDLDPDSGVSHITKAIATLVVMRDAMIQNMLEDDRPPKTDLEKLRADLQAAMDNVIERVPDEKEPYTERNKYDV